MDIHNHEFKKSFRGYNENEVDDFLDRIVMDYEKVLRENEKLKERAHLNEKEISHYKGLERNLQDTLMVAQKAAEEVMGAARRNANDLRENAANEAQSIHENTIREAQNIRMQAHLDAKHCIDDAANRLHAVAIEYERIVREKNSFLLKIRTALESELAVISQLLSTLPSVSETDSIQAVAMKIERKLQEFDKTAPKSDYVATTPITTSKSESLTNATPEPADNSDAAAEDVNETPADTPPADIPADDNAVATTKQDA